MGNLRVTGQTDAVGSAIKKIQYLFDFGSDGRQDNLLMKSATQGFLKEPGVHIAHHIIHMMNRM